MIYKHKGQKIINGISLLNLLIIFIVLMTFAGHSEAGATAGCVNGPSGSSSLECGNGSTVGTTGAESTAVGSSSNATGEGATAYGRSTVSTGRRATALGRGANATGEFSVAVGTDNTDSGAVGTTASGSLASAFGSEAIASGDNSMALGADSQATAPGAIAIGVKVVADIANTMIVGTPIRIIRNDGISQLRVNEKIAGNSVQTLFNLICDTCTPGFRFNQVLPSNQTWFFRMLQTGNFSVDDPATTTKEAEFRSGGDLKIGGTLFQASSREIKTDFVELDHDVILKKVDQLPITQWSYKKDKGKINHIGPMAEDFYALFDVGLDNKGLSSVDTVGVALAAIKALNQKVSEIDYLKSENEQLKSRISNLESQSAELSELKAQVARLIRKESETQIAQISY